MATIPPHVSDVPEPYAGGAGGALPPALDAAQRLFVSRRSALLAMGGIALVGCVPIQNTTELPEHDAKVTTPLDGKTIIEGGTLVMALSSEPDRLDPSFSTSLYTRYVMETMCEKLYDIAPDGSIVPQLAADMPQVSEDGLTVDIPVRTGITFGDGTPFDAEAVRITLDRNVNNEKSARRSEMGPVVSIEAVTPELVRIVFETPFAPLTASLADRAGMILSPTALEERGDDFASNPVGVGAFRFVERVPQTAIHVERDPHYYDADKVHIDRIEYRIMSDANIRAANIRSRDVQVADTISPQDMDALVREGIPTLNVESLGYQGITINHREPADPSRTGAALIASSPEARQALSMAFDRDALASAVFNGWYLPAPSGIPDSSPFASEKSRAMPSYDPEGAKALLESIGAELPVKLRMIVSNAQDALRFAQALQAQAKDAGFDIEIMPTEYTTVLDAQQRGDFEILQLGWSGRVDPHGNLYNYLYSSGTMNYSGINSPELDQLLDQAAAVTDTAERAQMYGEVVELGHEIAPILYLYRQRNLVAHTDEVAGVSVYPDGVVRLSRAAFVEEN